MDDNKDQKPKFELINTLSESRMFRNKQSLIKMDADSAKNAFFLYVLGLYALSQDGASAEWAQQYASRTRSFGNFDHFRTSGTDLYMLAYLLTGSEQQFGKVDTVLLFKKSNLNITFFKQFLANIAKDTNQDNTINSYLMRVERELGIRDGRFRALRRQVGNWNDIPDSTKKSVLADLYKFIRLIDVKAEILSVLKKSKSGVSLDNLSTAQKAALATATAAASFGLGYKWARKKK